MAHLFDFPGDDPLPVHTRLDKVFSWTVRNPVKAITWFFGLLCGIPFLVGLTVGFTLGALLV